jgi:hypothetical protein
MKTVMQGHTGHASEQDDVSCDLLFVSETYVPASGPPDGCLLLCPPSRSVLLLFTMALLDSAYGMFSALAAAQDLSLLSGDAGWDLSELADFVEAAVSSSNKHDASNAAQLVPHLEQRRFLNKAAAAATRQLELLSAHLQSATSLAPLHGRALECAKVLLQTPTYLPHVWLEHSYPDPCIEDTADTVQRDLADAGGCMGQRCVGMHAQEGQS